MMRKIWFILLCISVVFIQNTNILIATPQPTIISDTKQDIRLHTLHDLFTTLGVKVELTYEAMNAFAQANWLRKPNQERWHMEKSEYQVKESQIIPIFRRLGMIDQVDPSIHNPDYAVILGATVSRMRTRIQHMFELIENGRFMPKQIIILVGARPLDPTQEPEAVLMNQQVVRKDWVHPTVLPTTESEAAKFIWDQLPKSDKVKSIPVTFIVTPMLKKNDKVVRPTTTDTMETWLRMSPPFGSIVAFSNNPYVPYQQETMKPALIKANWFKQGGTLETVGTAANESQDVANLLDNTARYIYSILQVEQALKQ
jgi:hypothetical protein